MTAVRPEQTVGEVQQPSPLPARRPWPVIEALVLLLPVALALAVTRRLMDPDLWWHLRAGELIASQGLVQEDPWSFASSNPWLLHAWLSELVMHWAHSLGGMGGVVVLQALVIGAFGLVLLLSCRRVARPEVAGICAMIAVTATITGFGTRPQLISWVLLALACPYLRRCVADRQLPWLILPLTWVWANLHGLWFTTLLLFGALVLGLAIEEGTRGWRVTARFGGLGLAALAVAAATPNGPSVLAGPGRVAETAQYIVEWNAPTILHPGPASALLLVAIVVIGWARSRVPVPPSSILFLGAATAVGLMYFRTVPVMAIAAAPMAAEVLQRGLGLPVPSLRLGTLMRVAVGTGALAGLAAVVLLAPTVATPHPAGNPSTTTSEAVMAASARLDALSGRAKVLNEYEFGGWLLWSARDTSPAVDGRAEIYDMDYLEGYLDALAMKPGWREFVDELDVDAALLHAGTPLAEGLRGNGWRAAFEQDELLILVPPRDGVAQG